MKKKIKSQTRQDVYQLITDIILEKLEQGVIPWKQRWNTQGPAANYLTKKSYRGINALLLNSISFVHPYFLTFKQTQQLGGKVKKGAKSLPVVYWQWNFYHKATGRKLTEEEVKALESILWDDLVTQFNKGGICISLPAIHFHFTVKSYQKC